MNRPYILTIPENVGELRDHLSDMLLSSPAFVDTTGYFPGANIDTTFAEFNDGLLKVRKQLGEQRYLTMRALSDEMRAHFEADPEDVNGRARAGRKIILEMTEMLKRR